MGSYPAQEIPEDGINRCGEIEMKTRLTFGMVFLLSVWTVAEEVGPELKKLQGSWIPVSAELAGQKLPDDFLRKTSLVIEKENYSSKVGDVTDRGKIKLVGNGPPKSMDITSSDPNYQGKSFPAIYEVEGNSLMVCYDLEGKKRPDGFKSPKGFQWFLVQYKKEK